MNVSWNTFVRTSRSTNRNGRKRQRPVFVPVSLSPVQEARREWSSEPPRERPLPPVGFLVGKAAFETIAQNGGFATTIPA